MDLIKKWLESETPDYNAGVLLFAKHSKNRSLHHYFARKVAMGKLHYELQKLANISDVKIKKVVNFKPVSPPKNERMVIDPEGKIKRKDLPEQLQKLFDKNTEDYKLMRGAHASMSVSENNAERAKLRMQIEQFDDAIAKRWIVIDHWAATGELPEATNNDIRSKPTPQQVNAWRTYISRYTTTDVDKLTDDKHRKLQQRFSTLLAFGHTFEEATIIKLKELGFTTE